MGVGVLPFDVYRALGQQLGLVAVMLDEEWAERSLIIVVRDADALSPVSRPARWSTICERSVEAKGV